MKSGPGARCKRLWGPLLRDYPYASFWMTWTSTCDKTRRTFLHWLAACFAYVAVFVPCDQARDKAYQTVFDEYDGGDIDQKEYIRKIVKMSRAHEEEDFAVGIAEDSSSESESELN